MNNRIDKFEKNILILSQSKEIKNAIEEWKIIPFNGKKKNIINEEEDKVICICCRKIKHYFTCVNIKTGKFIHAGGGCIKRFPYEKINNKILETILSVIRDSPVEYENIEEPEEYSNEILNKILNAYKIGIIQCKNKNLDDCINMHASITIFKDTYNINYSEQLNYLITEIEDIISKKRKLLEEKEKREREENEQKIREIELEEIRRIYEEREQQREIEERLRLREIEQVKRLRILNEQKIRELELEEIRRIYEEREQQRELEKINKKVELEKEEQKKRKEWEERVRIIRENRKINR